MRQLVVRGDRLVADLAEEGQLVLTFGHAQVIDHVQLAELDIVELLVADVTRVDGHNPALAVLPRDYVHVVRVPENEIHPFIIFL